MTRHEAAIRLLEHFAAHPCDEPLPAIEAAMREREIAALEEAKTMICDNEWCVCEQAVSALIEQRRHG